MPYNVVVAVDGGTASAAALDWVVDRARSVAMHVEVTTVVDIDWIPQVNTDPVLLEHERIVDEAGRRIRFSGVSAEVSTTVQHARRLPGLEAASRRADLLVIGSHKTRGAVGLIYGTLPLAVAARTHCPLVVVPVGWQPGGERVIVGVDDETGAAAMAFAAREAEREDDTLVAVRAWDVPPLVSGAWEAMESPIEAFESSERAVLDAEVARVHAAHPDLPVEAVLEHGRASVVLARRAEGARLAVVGTHGRGRLAGLLLGSVSHDLLMNMPCPVAVVPITGEAGHIEPTEQAAAEL